MSDSVRRLERRLDRCHEGLDLLNRPLADAVTTVTAYVDMRLCQAHLSLDSEQMILAVVDDIINMLRHPYSWVFGECEKGGRIPSQLGSERLEEATALFGMADQYDSCWILFPLWHRGVIDLEVDDDSLVISNPWLEHPEYEAYNRLTSVPRQSLDFSLAEEFGANLDRSVQAGRSPDEIIRDSRLVGSGLGSVRSVLEGAFEVPDGWSFSSYSIEEFRQVATALRVMAMVGLFSRMKVMLHGDPSGFFPTAFRHRELTRFLAGVTDVSRSVVNGIIRRMTFAAVEEIKVPDPALQPVIPVRHGSVVLPLVLHAYTSPERNHLVLLNMLEEERAIYLELVDEKESHLRDEIVEGLPPGVRWTVLPLSSKAPEADLILWDDAARKAVAIELKWFLRPAEIREIINRDEDLTKGTAQAEAVAEALKGDSTLRGRVFGDFGAWDIHSLVISKNWIGYWHVQSEDTPIITARHFLAKLEASRSLPATLAWLASRRYLPITGRDFQMEKVQRELLGIKWSWYGIRPLVAEGFLPL